MRGVAHIPCCEVSQVGEVELMDGSAAVQVHQSQLETVIPQPGGR